MSPLLRMTGIEKRFGPVTALDGVDFTLEAGQIHALLGVNGAGKSTLVKILSGVYTADAGEIAIDGTPVALGSPRAAMAAGVAAVQQHPELVPDLSGIENIFLGHEGRRPGLFARIDRPAMRTAAARLLARFPVEIDLDRPVGEMPAVDREIVAVLHALRAEHTRILILDEPTSTLTEREKASLFAMMRALRAAGIAIVYITHRLEEVFEVADSFTVFRGGRNVASFTAAEAKARGVSIPELMLAEKAGELFPPRDGRPEGDAPILAAENLGLAGCFSGVSFALRRGEILGIFGLVGSGVDELSKALFGALPHDEGRLIVKGRERRFSGPHEALKAGVFLVPGDRRTEGLTLTEDVVFNTTVAHLGRASALGLLRFGRNRREAARLARETGLSPPALDRPASAFSGGNQQKIVIAKGLFRDADVYVFTEPTVGVDIGARAKIYGLMRDLSRRAGVIVVSSDCDEVHGLADRTLALYKGRPVPAAPSRDGLLAAGIMGARAA